MLGLAGDLDRNKLANKAFHIDDVRTPALGLRPGPAPAPLPSPLTNPSQQFRPPYLFPCGAKGARPPDVEWYLATQIHPPITRLCEHVQGPPPPGPQPIMHFDGVGVCESIYSVEQPRYSWSPRHCRKAIGIVGGEAPPVWDKPN